MPVRRAAFLTAGGLAPCLSAAVGGLIERYTQVAPEVELVGYLDGYAGLLAGRHVTVTPDIRSRAHLLQRFGGSPIGNSRVKLTNAEDLVRRGLVEEGDDPLRVAAERLTSDGVDVLHTIGGDDTSLDRGRPGRLPAHERPGPDRRRAPQDDRQRHRAGRPEPGRGDRRGAGSPVRPEHPGRALLEPPDAHRARGHGPQLRLAHRGHRPRVPHVARVAGVRGLRQGGPPVGHPRGLRPRARDRPRCRVGASPGGHGRARLREHLPRRGRGGGHHRRRDDRGRRAAEAGPLRPRQARHDQPRRLVRGAVRGAHRGGEEDDPEERLLLPVRGAQPGRPGADRPVHRARRRRRAARRERAGGPRRGRRGRAVGDRLLARSGAARPSTPTPTGSPTCCAPSASPRGGPSRAGADPHAPRAGISRRAPLPWR